MFRLEDHIEDDELESNDGEEHDVSSTLNEEHVSCFKISYDTGKAVQLFCDPFAQCVGFSSANLCGLLLLCCCELCHPQLSNHVSDEERTELFVQRNKPRVEYAGLFGSSLVRVSANAAGNLFGFFRAGTQLCLGPIQASDNVLNYTPAQINNAPGICDKISLWDELDLTPKTNEEPMQNKIA